VTHRDAAIKTGAGPRRRLLSDVEGDEVLGVLESAVSIAVPRADGGDHQRPAHGAASLVADQSPARFRRAVVGQYPAGAGGVAAGAGADFGGVVPGVDADIVAIAPGP